MFVFAAGEADYKAMHRTLPPDVSPWSLLG